MRFSLTVRDGLFVFVLLISSCTHAIPQQDRSENEASVSTTAAPSMTPTAFPPTVVVSRTAPQSEAEYIWARYLSSGRRVYALYEAEAHELRLPVSMGQFYGYDPQSDEILMAQKFPDRGAGPANVSVSDLSILHLETASVAVVREDDVVEALWSPGGAALAYILATETTYELHWRTRDGADHVLAEDVSFTWSIAPVGRAVAFTRESGYGLDFEPGLFVVDIDSGDERMIAGVDKQGTGSIADQPYWSPDGREVILSHWGGPDEPRLILANADGSGSIDLKLDNALANEWWAAISLTKVIWDVDGRHLLAISSVASSEMGGPSPLVYYRLDREAHTLTNGVLLAEVEDMLGWAPGRAVWVLTAAGKVIQIALP